MEMLFLPVLLLILFVCRIDADFQTVEVFGTLNCKGTAFERATIEIWERDYFSPNDLLNETKSDISGTFSLSGEEDEALIFFTPYITIEHSCDVPKLDHAYLNVTGCKRTAQFPIPSGTIGGIYNMSIIDLETPVTDEVIRCHCRSDIRGICRYVL